ncbi:hypothetical protein M3Y96_00001200 [Aphelenchoides besseyi]|nr:hypothetical protein M3Y96_00001200 [Aphelenchoides besseyi]
MMSSSLSSQTSLPNKSFSYNSDMSRSLNDTSTLKRNCNTGNKFMSMSSYAPSNAYASTGTLLAYRLRFNHLTSTSGFRNSNREDNIDDAYNRICNRYGPSSGKTEPPISTSDTTTNTTLNRSSVSVQDETIPSQTVDSKDKESIEEAGKLPLSLNTADAKPRTQSADANKKTSTATAINISDNLNDTTIEKTYLKLESPRLQTLPSSPRSADFSSQQTPKPDPFLTDCSRYAITEDASSC